MTPQDWSEEDLMKLRPHATPVDCATAAARLRRRGWSEPTDRGQHSGRSG
jgi:hypothetical protein